MTRVRTRADLGRGDEVRTRTGRLAVVTGFDEDAVELMDSYGAELTLLPHHLTLVRKAPPHRVPPEFYRSAAQAEGRMP